MSKNSIVSKSFAGFFVFMTIVVTGSLIGMIIIFNIRHELLDPSPPPTISTTTLAPPPEMRLRGDLLPEKYTIFIKVHFYSEIPEEFNVTSPNQTLYFDGNVTIDLRCVETTKTIFLHSRNQNVSQAVVTDLESKKHLEVENLIFHSDQTDFLEIQLDETLKAGKKYSLFLAFSADVNEYPDGLFLSTYSTGESNSEEDKRFLVATNLQPTSTRTVFPCFDEPSMKAKFELTVIHREGTTALSNTGVRETNTIDGWKHTEFYETEQKISTYLFAFTVSEFTSQRTGSDDRSIKTYARPEAVEAGHTNYAASITGDILDFYEGYFGVPYRLKLDQLALPDLGPAAMENWGLVTYQEGLLLYEEGVSSELHKEVIASLIAHELAHQWFGNLVTMKWWNELWLNEGFATYMSSLAVDKVEPSFRVRELTIAHELHAAFEADALASSHPLTPPAAEVQTTDEILTLFDSITYSKGSTVLRMLMNVLGEKVFHEGIKIYLKRHQEDNTNQHELWKAMDDADTSGAEDIPKLMDTWTNQAGYPVITINTTSGEVTQKRFLFNSTAVSNSTWRIPVTLLSASGDIDREPMFIDRPKVTDEKFQSKKGEWILANVNCTGFYRVNYDLTNWARLLNELETSPQSIPLLNRGQLIDDAFNLARAKQVSVSLALSTTRFLYHETDYIPWESAMRNLHYFVLMFDRSEVYGPMQLYLRNQVTQLYSFFKNDTDNSTVPEDHSLQYNQINAIKMACSNGLTECLDMVKDMFHFWMTNGTNKIHPNLRSVIYCQAIAAGGQEEWEFAWKQFENSTDISEKDQLLEAMTCTKKIWLLNRYLEYTLDPTKIRLMDVSTVISYIAQNEAGHALAWNFLRANWDYVSQLHGAYLILEVTSRFSTPFELEELEHFATKYDVGSESRAVENAIEQTKVNIKWVAEHRDTVLDWFRAETSRL